MLWVFRVPLATLSRLFMVSYVRLFSCMHLRWSASFSHLSAQPSNFLSAFQKCCFAYWFYFPSWVRCLVRPLLLIYCKPVAQANHHLRRFFCEGFVLSNENSCRITPRERRLCPKTFHRSLTIQDETRDCHSYVIRMISRTSSERGHILQQRVERDRIC